MRVLHVIDGLSGSGGAENRLVEEALHFGPGTEQLVVRLFAGDDLDGRLVAAGIPVRALGFDASSASYNWPLAVARLLPVIRSFRPDVVHTSLFAGNLVGQLAARLAGLPVVSTMTLTADPRLFEVLGSRADTRRAAAMRRLAGWSSALSGAHWRAVTEDTKASNCRSFRIPPERATVIHRGVDARRARVQPDRARFGLPPGPLFVNVARHAAQKGHVLLVEAFARVVRDVPQAQLAVAGRAGPVTPQIEERIATLGLAGRVHLLGFRADSDVLVASADAFLFSSLAEGIASAVLEAVVAGLPVVAFDIPPVREVTAPGRAATLVPPRDLDAFARAAVEALELRRRPELLEERRRWVLEHFELTAVAGRLEALLGDVAAAHAARRTRRRTAAASARRHRLRRARRRT